MIQKLCLLSLWSCVLCFSLIPTASGQSKAIWTEMDHPALQSRSERALIPAVYRTFRLDKAALSAILDRGAQQIGDAVPVISLPMPDGSMARFKFQHSLVVEPGLAEKYPELGRTYSAAGIDDPTATARFDLLPSGFHAIVLSSRGTSLIDPYAKGDTINYIVYEKEAATRSSEFACEFEDQNAIDSISTPIEPARFEFFPNAAPSTVSGSQLRTYRLALAANWEYCNAASVGGNTIANCLAAQVLVMNRVNGVYERDLAIHMNLVATNNLVVYAGDQICTGVACTAANDPYSNGTGALSQNTTNLNAVIGAANYDIGHVFTTGSGGVASLNVPCGSNKGAGTTGLSDPTGDPFAIDYVAHEMGHQWGGRHTFNGAVSNCAGSNRSAIAAYEPGSGITIMAYAGICGSQNLAANSIDTFHVKSLEEIIAYSQTGQGNTCAVITPSGNTPPVVTVVGGTSFNVPKRTPFALTASATDVDGDSVTYDWQEYDLGAATTAVPNTDAGGAMPIFRPYLPTASGTRYFPALQFTRDNANAVPATTGGFLTGELMPVIARVMNFQVIARDNRPRAGGVSTATATVNIEGSSGPFDLTAPNTAINWTGGSNQTVAWNVANTTAAPINAANVKISLSTDGGLTFPTTVVASTPNDGTQVITVPNVNTSQARIKVEPIGNIFFDISDANFSISSTPFDFDGDGRADASVYRNGNWYVLGSMAGVSAAQFGIAGDRTVAADYDGDGKTDLAVFRDGAWFVQRSQGGLFIGQFGSSGDIPIAGDYTGDGKADLTVFRGGMWYTHDPSNGAVSITQFGLASDKPVVGDWDGDGRQDVAVYRNGVWYVNASTLGFLAYNFGLANDIPVPADFDGDSKTDYAIYRDGVWFIQRSTAGFIGLNFGISTDVPTPADYDGDGRSDAAVFRDGTWFQNGSQTGVSIFNFGLPGDRAVPAQRNQ